MCSNAYSIVLNKWESTSPDFFIFVFYLWLKSKDKIIHNKVMYLLLIFLFCYYIYIYIYIYFFYFILFFIILTGPNYLEFSASLLQSTVSHDPSETILICWFATHEIFIIIINIKNCVLNILVETVKLPWIESSREKHLFEIECLFFVYKSLL